MQEFVDSHPPFLPFDPRRIQIQVVDLGQTTPSMHNHVRLKHARLPRSHRSDRQPSGTLFDPYRFGCQTDVNVEVAGSLNELINEIRIKKGKWSRAAVQDRDLRSCTRRHMRKLKGDIPASDKQNPPRSASFRLATCQRAGQKD